MRSPTRSLDYPSTAQSCGHEYCWHGHRPHVRWWNSVGRPYHTDCNGQSIHKVGVTRYGIKLLSCVFQCSLKGPQSYNMYKNPPLGFLMLFCHVFIDAPEKLPKFGAFSTLGTALVETRIVHPVDVWRFNTSMMLSKNQFSMETLPIKKKAPL